MNAENAAERAQVASSIDFCVALNAQLIAAVPASGYGATRDAYCEERPGG